MNNTRVVLQPAFVLHSKPYRDTSLLVELFTQQYGRLTIIGRGVRGKRSKSRGLFSPFLPLLVSFGGKTDLQTLQHIEAKSISYNLNGHMLLSGFYLNELLIRLLQRHDPHPNIFQAYQQTLAVLANSKNPEHALRLFEKYLLIDLGYGLQLNHTLDNEIVLANEKYIFEFGSGLKKAKANEPNNFLGQSLLALQAETLTTQEEFRDAKRLLRSVLAVLLGNKPLKCRELFLL